MKNEDVIIRPFETTDTVELSKIWFEASLLAHPFIGESRLMDQKTLIEEQYLPSAETWVAILGDQPVGFISLIETFIGGLFVSPDWQGLGIGWKLTSHALTLKSELSLEVYTDNTQAMNFYSRFGFQEVSRRSVDDEGYPFKNARLRVIG